MLGFLPKPLIGVIAVTLLILNTLFWALFLYIPALLKLIVPHKGFRVGCTRLIIWVAENWVAGNNAWMRLTQRTRWYVTGAEELERSLITGGPSECIEYLEDMERSEVTHVLFRCALDEVEQALQTIRVLGDDVIPHFKKTSQSP